MDPSKSRSRTNGADTIQLGRVQLARIQASPADYIGRIFTTSEITATALGDDPAIVAVGHSGGGDGVAEQKGRDTNAFLCNFGCEPEGLGRPGVMQMAEVGRPIVTLLDSGRLSGIDAKKGQAEEMRTICADGRAAVR